MEGGEPPAKKRGSDRQISQLDPDAGSGDEEPKGPFAKASEEVLKSRKIVSVKRKAVGADAPGANPFSGVSLFGAPKPAAGGDGTAAAPSTAPSTAPLFGSFGAAAKTNPFAFAAAASSSASGFTSSFAAAAASSPSGGLAGASAPAATFAPAGEAAEASPAADAPASASAPAAAFSFASAAAATDGGDASRSPPIASVFGSAAAAPASIFGSTALASAAPALGGAAKAPAASVLSDEKQMTGEEEDTVGFAAEATLYEFTEAKTWKERGKGEVRINLAASGQARFVMRQRGNLRLLLNANLWPGINVALMDGGKGVTFAVINAAAPGEEEGEPAKQEEAKLGTYAVRFKSKDHVTEFTAVVEANKSKGEPNGGDPKEAPTTAEDEADGKAEAPKEEV
mmetsp:Transcript_25015/g.62955  ORF Transcript_25015/g.62955 Transcript_25015/m.62955 type:complete len:398 (-) Transcript_25015:748-1941(-)